MLVNMATDLTTVMPAGLCGVITTHRHKNTQVETILS